MTRTSSVRNCGSAACRSRTGEPTARGASAIAHKANDDGATLRQAALATGYVSADDFDRIVNPAKMVGDPAAATATA